MAKDPSRAFFHTIRIKKVDAEQFKAIAKRDGMRFWKLFEQMLAAYESTKHASQENRSLRTLAAIPR